MKKLLLATAVVFAASQVAAEVYTVTLTGTQTQTSPDGTINLGGGVSTTVADMTGTYDSSTGILSFGEGSINTEQDADVFGTIVNLTLTSSMTVNFNTSTGSNNVATCQGREGTNYGPGQPGAGQAGFACGFATGEQALTEVSSINIANPFDANGQFSFTGMVYNEQATVTQSFTVTNDVPVPAAVWLFGSALAGLAGLRKRK